MKTFLINTAKNLKKISNKLNINSIICSKEWIIFSEDYTAREVYIFQKNGTLIASFNGKITYASWDYLSANHSFIIKLSDRESYMFKLVAFNQDILTFQLDGENRFCFFLTENLIQQTMPSLLDIKIYLFQHCQFNLFSTEELSTYHQLLTQKAKKENLSQENMIWIWLKKYSLFTLLGATLLYLIAHIIYHKIEQKEEKHRWNPEISTTQEENKQSIDLGLSVEWATCNVGANTPEEIGNYYDFGFPDGKPHVVPFYQDKDGYEGDGSICGKNEDMAKANWGEDWRLPTQEEAKELVQSCKTDLIRIKNIKCLKVTGKNGNSIIIPFGGFRNFQNAMINGLNEMLFIWTGSYFIGDYERSYTKMGWDNNYKMLMIHYSTLITTESDGLPVRAVRDKR